MDDVRQIGRDPDVFYREHVEKVQRFVARRAAGQTCERTPRGTGFAGYYSSTDNWDGQQSTGVSFTLNPAEFRGATLLIEGSGYFDSARGAGGPTMVRAGFKITGSYGPCVVNR